MRRHPHAFLHVLWALLISVSLLAIGLGFGVHERSESTVRQIVAQAAVNAAAIPDRECSSKLGAAYMGCGAPAQAFGLANYLGIAAGDPDDITTPIGVDVSNNNGTIDWAPFFKAHPNVKFVYDKATESDDYTDTQLAHNLAGERAAKIAYGVYDFIRCGWSTPQAEAGHFVAVVKANNAAASLPPAADVELNDGCTPAQMRAYVATWMSIVAKAFPARGPPIVYTDEGFWNSGVGGENDGTRLWAADWAANLVFASSWKTWTFWQYASSLIGPKPYIGGWDMDTFNGTVAQLDKLAGITAGKTKKKITKPKKTTTKPKNGQLVFKAQASVSRKRVVWVTASCENARCHSTAVLRAEVGLGKHDPIITRWGHHIAQDKSGRHRFVISKSVYAEIEKHRIKIKADHNPHTFWIARTR